MSEDPRKYDSAFYSIIQHEGNIDGFLEAVFGFLYRRYHRINVYNTDSFNIDFYYRRITFLKLDTLIIRFISTFCFYSTDFYRIMTNTQKKMGFPPGVAEQKTMTVGVSGAH